MALGRDADEADRDLVIDDEVELAALSPETGTLPQLPHGFSMISCCKIEVTSDKINKNSHKGYNTSSAFL